MQNKEYSVLYTHQKTKKRKTWQDGTLLFQQSNNKVILYNDQRSLLDSLFVSSGKIYCGMDLESDRYLITIEHEKNEAKTSSSQDGKDDARQVVSRTYILSSVRKECVQPPKFKATEKRLYPDDEFAERPDKRIKPLREDTRPCHDASISEQIPSKPGFVTRDQFFSLYANQRDQSLSIQRGHTSHSISNNYSNNNYCSTKMIEESTKSCTAQTSIGSFVADSRESSQIKRNPSQILALFSSNANHIHTQSHHQECCNSLSNDILNNTSRSSERCFPAVAMNKSHDSFFFGDSSEEKVNSVKGTAPSSLCCTGHHVNRGVDSKFASMLKEKENRLVEETERKPFLNHLVKANKVIDHLEGREKRTGQETRPSGFELITKSTEDDKSIISNKNQNLRGPSMSNKFNEVKFHFGSKNIKNSLRNKTKNTYSTTPYLPDSLNDKPLSEWDKNTQISMYTLQSTFKNNEQRLTIENNSHQPDMWDGSIDLFEVPDVGWDMKEFTDGVTSDFYASEMNSYSAYTMSRQSEQEKSDLVTSWKGSITSDTVKRESVVPTSLLKTPQFMSDSPVTELIPQHDQNDVQWLGNYPMQQSSSISQIVPKLRTRNKKPLSTSPASSLTTFNQGVPSCFESHPLSSELPNHYDSESGNCRQDAGDNHMVEELKSQINKIFQDSSKALSTSSSDPRLESDCYSKFAKQGRRVGLRKPGRVLGLPRAGSFNINQRASTMMQTNKCLMMGSTTVKESMMGELIFPSAKECEDNVKPCRQVTLPITFNSEQQYRHTMKAALREHLNIIIFELAQSYYGGLRKVNISHYTSLEQVDTNQDERPRCSHGVATLRSVKKDGPNKGRLFYCCPGQTSSKCKMFKWANECRRQGKPVNKDLAAACRPTLSSPQEITSYFKSQNVSLYWECHLIAKKTKSFSKKGKYKYSKRNEEDGDVCPEKTTLYLELSRRENSTAYSKDDIWIVSKDLSFDKRCTFVGKSAYFGPFSSGELEISPISGYSPSKWQSGDSVFALHGCNAANELMCIENIDSNVKTPFMPLLPRLLAKCNDNTQTISRGYPSTFVPPTRCFSTNVDISAGFAFGLAEEVIREYHLNMDQAAAMYDCAGMFSSDNEGGVVTTDISLIHGVFGAGKSYLLAVMIIYLVKLFNGTERKILVSSTTNVAVDRILLGLLELGFEEFVRVGSVCKIAKSLLPYSMHGTGGTSDEIKEFQAMLKQDLEPSEKMLIKRSIELQRKGGNKQRLTEAPVVGVTCAACVFPCLENMKFHVLLLDECSQMTEPAALLPLARFCCNKLVLVGDPKQLSPTIQGSHPDHDAGLEQTMFDRLVKMGYKTTLLRTQYRCHPLISAIANRLFYRGQLKNGVSEEDRAPIVEFAPTLCFYDVTSGKEKCGQDNSYYNEDEAKFVAFLISCLIESGLQPAQIGVITLYKSQLQTISSFLMLSDTASVKQLKSIQISTVDAFQGGEKDVIVLSCVRTDHVGFIDCDRRTNVALTRAKRHLLIVGNQRMLSGNKMWSNVIQHCKDHKRGIVTASDFRHSWQRTGNPDKSSTTCDMVKPAKPQNKYQISKEELVKPADLEDSKPVLVMKDKDFNSQSLDDEEFEDSNPVLIVDKLDSSPTCLGLKNMLEDEIEPNICPDDYSKPRITKDNQNNYNKGGGKDDLITHGLTSVLLGEDCSSKNDFFTTAGQQDNNKSQDYDDQELDDSAEFKELRFDEELINCNKESKGVNDQDRELKEGTINAFGDHLHDRSGEFPGQEIDTTRPVNVDKSNKESQSNEGCLSSENNSSVTEELVAKPPSSDGKSTSSNFQQIDCPSQEISPEICSQKEFTYQKIQAIPHEEKTFFEGSSAKQVTKLNNFQSLNDVNKSFPGTKANGDYQDFPAMDSANNSDEDLPFFDIFSSMN